MCYNLVVLKYNFAHGAVGIFSPETEWVWQPLKHRAKRRRHGISLSDALYVFGDPFAASFPDPHPDGNRWRTLGVAFGIVLLFVVHTAGGTWAASSAYEQQQGVSADIMRKASPDIRRHGNAARDATEPDAETLARLRVVAAMRDEDIDRDDPDAPEATDLSGGVRGKFFRPIKRLKSFRIDADVLDYFESQGRGYQAVVNQVLREAMQRGVQVPPDAGPPTRGKT